MRCAGTTTAIWTTVSSHHFQICSELYNTKYQAVHTSHQRACGVDDVDRLQMTVLIVSSAKCARLCEEKWGERAATDSVETHLQHGFTPPIQAHIQHTDAHRWTETNREKGERLTELLPLLYLWRLSQQANCITNRLIIQREKRRCWGRERRRDGHKKEGWSQCQLAIKKEKLDFFCNKKSSCQKFPMWQMFSQTSPFVLSEKRRRFAGWSLRAERCSSSTRFRRDPWLCWTSSRCEVPSFYLSIYLLFSPLAPLPLPVSVVGRAQLPQWKSIKSWMNSECCSAETLTLQYWIGAVPLLPHWGAAERDGGKRQRGF